MLVISREKLRLASGILFPQVGKNEAGTLRHYEAGTAEGTSGYD